MILEVNGYPVGGETDLEKLKQLAEAEPPLCLKLATRSPQGLEAWIPPGSGKVRKKRRKDYEQPEEDRGEPESWTKQEGCRVEQGGALIQIGTLGHGRWGQKDPWNKSHSGVFQFRWGQGKGTLLVLERPSPSLSA